MNKPISRYFYLTTNEAELFEIDTDERLTSAGFQNLGTHYDEVYDEVDDNLHPWTAYHHHRAGVTVKVSYDPQLDLDKHQIGLHGLEAAVQSALGSLKLLNITPEEITGD